MEYHLTLPLDQETIQKLRVGDFVYLTGPMLTARDAAHKRLTEALARGEALPVDLDGETVYYMGPSPAAPGRVIGAAGPTTAGRMDAYAPTLLDRGLRVMIAKGKRNAAVKEAIVRNGALYLAAIGGAGALLSECIKSSEVLAYEDLG
ncbi:MAG: fumarate hydratase C-terminal domain-containing protein, partial [Lachnospiraceae bacterium]|nr:fumarate hydratase C-terminal domain-containing protein [Lachnospiraceae bacterium]